MAETISSVETSKETREQLFGRLLERGDKSTQQRGAEIANELSTSAVFGVGRGIIPDFNMADLNRGNYSHEDMDKLIRGVQEKEKQQETQSNGNGGGGHDVEKSRSHNENNENKKDDNDAARRIGKKAFALGMAGALAVGAIGGAVTMNKIANRGDQPDTGKEIEENKDDSKEKADEQEKGETAELKDNYKSHYANPDGTGVTWENTSEWKKSSPEAFGTAIEIENPEDIKPFVEYIADHETSLFTTYYYEFDDSLKVEGTQDLSTSELKQKMMEDPEMHQKMVDVFLAQLMAEEDSFFNFTNLNGHFENYFARTTAADGENVTTENTEAVHCETDENGAKAVTWTYKNAKGEYVTMTFKLACGGQPVHSTSDKEGIRKMKKGTPELKKKDPKPEKPDPKPDDPEPEQKLTPKKEFKEKKVFEGSDTKEWDKDDKGSGSAHEKPSKKSTTEKKTIEKDGTTSDNKKEQSSESKQASQEKSSQANPEKVKEETKKAEQQQQVNKEQEKHQESVKSQPSGKETIKQHTDSKGDVDLDALLDMD